MHVIISDLHLTDQDEGDPPSDAELARFVETLAASNAGRHITMVLLGDIVDLLRSRKWDPLASQDNPSFPWSGMCAKFANFTGSRAEDCGLAVIQGIRARYPLFEKLLKQLVDRKQLTVKYVIGNHDYMAQISVKIRTELCDFLSLDHDVSRQLDKYYTSEEASLYATHGHLNDPVNLHLEDSGVWAFGDAVVLQIVNRFAQVARTKLGLGPNTDLSRRLQQIDNVEPHSDVPLFVRWLARELENDAQRTDFIDAWKQTVDEFLALDEFRPRGWLKKKWNRVFGTAGPYDGNEVGKVRRAFELSKSERISRLGSHLLKYSPLDDYRLYAQEVARLQQNYRFIVFGHTHIPVMAPLAHRVGEHNAFYVNTGCWRYIVSRPDRDDTSHRFVGHRISCHFQINLEQSDKPYVFVQQRHTV